MSDMTKKIIESITRTYEDYDEQVKAVIDNNLANSEQEAEDLLEEYDNLYC